MLTCVLYWDRQNAPKSNKRTRQLPQPNPTDLQIRGIELEIQQLNADLVRLRMQREIEKAEELNTEKGSK